MPINAVTIVRSLGMMGSWIESFSSGNFPSCLEWSTSRQTTLCFIHFLLNVQWNPSGVEPCKVYCLLFLSIKMRPQTLPFPVTWLSLTSLIEMFTSDFKWLIQIQVYEAVPNRVLCSNQLKTRFFSSVWSPYTAVKGFQIRMFVMIWFEIWMLKPANQT